MSTTTAQHQAGRGQLRTGTIAYPWYTLGLGQAKTPLADFSLKETMLVDKLSVMLPFLAPVPFEWATVLALVCGPLSGAAVQLGALRSTTT